MNHRISKLQDLHALTQLSNCPTNQAISQPNQQLSKSPQGINSGAELDLAKFVEGLIASRRISCKDYQRLSDAVLADGKIDEEERYQINRLFDAIQKGRVKIII